MPTKTIKPYLDIQGHRGCRGLMPENTIEGFIKAIELGVNTLELDVVISKDSQVIVSHEPYFNHLISTHPDGIEITEKNDKDFNLYLMTLEAIQKFDVGTKVHPKFPLQSKIKSFKPSLKQVIDHVEMFIKKSKLRPVRYNIEIKYDHRFVGKYFPDRILFCQLVMNEIVINGIKPKCNIQSFDPEILNIIHQQDNTFELSLLVENIDSFRLNLDRLNFKPQIYSPHFKLIDQHLLKYCHQNHIKVIPWTVNETNDISDIIKLGVAGIISDYPDRVIEIYEGMYPSIKQ